MLLGARQFFERRGAPLPYDAEVEYLQNTGTQYIDIGLTPDLDYEFESKVLWTAKNGLGLFGIYEGENMSYRLFGYQNKAYFDCGDAYYSGGRVDISGLSLNVAYTVRAGNRYISLDDRVSTRSRFPAFTGPFHNTMRLFSIGDIGGDRGRIYWLKITKSGVLVRDFASVRFTNELGQSEGAMYDRVSGALFRNAGTGAFTIGPDKS